MNKRYSRITGTGSYLPPRRVTNQDLANELAQRGIETSDAWIVERTGIRERRVAEDMPVSELAYRAAKELEEKLSSIRPRDLGQAARISGVTPADIAILSVWLKKCGDLNLSNPLD